MKYQAVVLKIDEDVEESVLLAVGGSKLTCFANVCPYRLEEGRVYPVQLELLILGEYEVEEAFDMKKPAFFQVGKGFDYIVRGWLDGQIIDVEGIAFQDEVLEREFGYLDGKFISLKADRINVEFLPI